MEIKGKVYCAFEQSGTFKNEFIKLGIPAIDIDIQNNFGQTDLQIDLFQEIEDAFSSPPQNRATIFDSMNCEDVCIAFFPCIYFCENNKLYFTGKHQNLSKLSRHDVVQTILERSRNRQYLYELCLKMFSIFEDRGLRLIVENPYNVQHFLVGNFPYEASVIDHNRSLRGDYFNKPTQYWFINCEPTNGLTVCQQAEHRVVKSSKPGCKAGICSEERSLISPIYARNFICDFILGKEQVNSQLSLF